MIISEIRIVMTPNSDEEIFLEKAQRTLVRNSNKRWTVEEIQKRTINIESDKEIEQEYPIEVGMLPYEIKLANDIQNEIILKFNGGVMK